VVWFNENLDDAVIDRIDDELDEADLLLIIGEREWGVGTKPGMALRSTNLACSSTTQGGAAQVMLLCTKDAADAA
jgi:hypothetical protein